MLRLTAPAECATPRAVAAIALAAMSSRAEFPLADSDACPKRRLRDRRPPARLVQEGV